MGLFRFLNQWREKKDGTLEGPALNTDELYPTTTGREPGTEAAKTLNGPANQRYNEYAMLRTGERILAGSWRVFATDTTISNTSFETVGRMIRVPHIPVPPGMTAVWVLTVGLENDSSDTSALLAENRHQGDGTTKEIVKVQDYAGTFRELQTEASFRDVGSPATGRYKPLAIEFRGKVGSGSTTFDASTTLSLYYEVL